MADEQDDTPLFELSAEELALLKEPSVRGGGWSKKKRLGPWAHRNLRFNQIAPKYATYDPAYDHSRLTFWKINPAVVEAIMKRNEGKTEDEIKAILVREFGPQYLVEEKQDLTDDEIVEALRKAPPELVKDKPVPMRQKGQLREMNKWWKYRNFKPCMKCSTFHTEETATRLVPDGEGGYELVHDPDLVGKVREGTYDTYVSRNSAATAGVLFWCFKCGAKDTDVVGKDPQKCPKCKKAHFFARTYDRAGRGTNFRCEACGFTGYRPRLKGQVGADGEELLNEDMLGGRPAGNVIWKDDEPSKHKKVRLHNIFWCLRHGIEDPLQIAIKLRSFGDVLADRGMVDAILQRIERVLLEERAKG